MTESRLDFIRVEIVTKKKRLSNRLYYFWRVVSPQNGQILCSSETYSRKIDAYDTAKLVTGKEPVEVDK